MPIKLVSKLFETVIEAESIEEMLDMLSEEMLPIGKGWTMKIGLYPHREMKPEAVYALKHSPKKEELMLKEHYRGKQYEHPIELDTSCCNCYELGFIPMAMILEFIQGLPSSVEYT